MTARAPSRPPPRWVADPCPPDPFALTGELALPPGAPVPGAWVVPGLTSARPVLSPGDRALAAALCCPSAVGVLVRATAAWVWTGEPSLVPTRLHLATPREAPSLPGPRPEGRPHRLPVQRVRADGLRGWTALRDVAVTDPLATAVDCARLPEVDLARRCLEALAGCDRVELAEVADRLVAQRDRPGSVRARELVARLQQEHEGRRRAACRDAA